jgi:serine/threonine protein phosphatase 1
MGVAMIESLGMQGPGRIPLGMRFYAVGDVHGMADALRGVMDRIDSDMGRRPPRVCFEIYLGDLVDRGPDSAGVLRMLEQRSRSRNVHVLLGNHEFYMQRALGDAAAFKAWLGFGGTATLRSYGLDIHADGALTAAEVRRAQGLLGKMMDPGVKALLASCLPLVRIGSFIFVHAGIRPNVPLGLQRLEDLTTIRQGFLDQDGPNDFTVVHGHTPVPAITFSRSRINLDTGCVAGGPLSCIAGENDRIWTV